MSELASALFLAGLVVAVGLTLLCGLAGLLSLFLFRSVGILLRLSGVLVFLLLAFPLAHLLASLLATRVVLLLGPGLFFLLLALITGRIIRRVTSGQAGP